jgi:hypothetical protein
MEKVMQQKEKEKERFTTQATQKIGSGTQAKKSW